VKALDQWRRLEARLDPDWDVVFLSFAAEDAPRAAAVLAPLGPGRVGSELRFQVTRGGAGPDRLENLLRRLDGKRVWGELALVDAETKAREETVTAVPARTRSLLAQWDEELAKLPPAGWSDLLCELELESTDLLARAALLGAPLNPTRFPDAIALRFRVSNGRGYGASPGMTRRCLERMEAEGIRGLVSVLEGISDAENVATQGPVWRIAGRSV
jgi:hypothetical protein